LVYPDDYEARIFDFRRYEMSKRLPEIIQGRLEMIVVTAFVRDPGYGSTRPDGRPVRFWIILHNTRHGLMIRT
jgi:hypothetical protein